MRQSRRIAQLKIKEQAERRQIEDVALYGLPKEGRSKTKQKTSQKVLNRNLTFFYNSFNILISLYSLYNERK